MALSIHPPIHPLADLPKLVKRPCRMAALDIGKKTLGLATCTPDWQMVTPLTTITRGKWQMDIQALEKALKGLEIKALLVGLPFNMDDSEGPQAQFVRQTVNDLIASKPRVLDGCVISFVDERLSTAGAENILDDRPRREAKASGALDAVAAQIILQRAIDLLHQQERTA